MKTSGGGGQLECSMKVGDQAIMYTKDKVKGLRKKSCGQKNIPLRKTGSMALTRTRIDYC